MSVSEQLKREKFYDLVRDEDGNERTVFSHMRVSTNRGEYLLGDKCPECDSPIVPRVVKVAGEYKTFPYCPQCKEEKCQE